MFRESMGLRLSNEVLLFGRKLTADEMLNANFASKVFPDASFQKDAMDYMKQQLEVNDFGSMLEAKKLIMAPIIEGRTLANLRWHEAVAKDFAGGRPMRRVAAQAEKLAGE